MNENPAYRVIQTKFINNDYEAICEAFGGGFENLPAWRTLGNLLAGRAGWHFDLNLHNAEPIWSLGTFGESLLLIHVNDLCQYHCYDHRADDDTTTTDVSAVEAWLEPREEQARRPSATLLEMAQANGWQTLKILPIPLRVSWSDGHFCAATYPLDEVSFGRTLPEAVNRAAEMICQFLGAPADIAASMTLTVELDASATARIRTV
ncbi:hypothetical protein AB0D14_42870 [Streptomyces sp. NPDC048484]|uniref:hypothetical protein n=1 Tax=Streptomyces sp. NPDC048484 TaxID=3155146 RepID=UPI00342CCC7F